MKMTKSMQDFILHWGEMGARWGTNRTVAQIFALLYLSEKPLNADDIGETLSVARSNVSTSLRELQSWGLVKTVTAFGDRKEYFTALGDIAEVFRVILAERKKREIDPTLSVLRDCFIAAENERNMDAHANRRLNEIHDFLVTATAWYEQFSRLSAENVARALKAGGSIAKLVGKGRK